MDYAVSFESSYHDSNYKRQYNTDAFYNEIIKKVSTKLKRQLEIGEQKQTINFIKNIDPNLLTPSLKGKTIPIMINTLSKEFSNNKCEKPFYDDSLQVIRDTIGVSSESGTSHGVYDNPSYIIKKNEAEKMKLTEIENARKITTIKESFENGSDVGVKNLLGISSASDAVRILNPKSQYKKNHILFDSRYRIHTEQVPDNITEFQWGYVQKSATTTDGSINVIGNVRDIIGFRIYPFRIPYTSSADNKYQRISVLIKEYTAQSFIAHENRNFHFMMNSIIDSEFITLEADVYNGYFWFEKALTAVDKLTLTFANPLELITFDRDRDFCSFDYFTLAPLTQITTTQIHNLQNGDRVYITDFDVGAVSPALIDQKAINTSIKDAINLTAGHLVTIISPTSFSISVNSSQIQNPLTTINPKIFYGSKRFFIPLEIIYINPENFSE